MQVEGQQDVKAQIDAVEKQLEELRGQLLDLRANAGAMPVPDYALQRPDGSAVNLSELFGDRDQLILIHNMGFACPYCTMWADGLNSLWRYVDKRAPFVLVSNDQPDQQLAGAQQRGWTFPMASARGTSMFADMNFAEEKDGQLYWWPGVSTLYKTPDGQLHRHAYAYFGPGDLYNAAWHLMDLLKHNDTTIEPTTGM